MDLDDAARLIATSASTLYVYTATGSGEGILLWLTSDAPTVVVRVGAVVQVLTTRRLRSATGREVQPAEAADLLARWRTTARPDNVIARGWRLAGRVSV